jgi:hypothetical protein
MFYIGKEACSKFKQTVINAEMVDEVIQTVPSLHRVIHIFCG